MTTSPDDADWVILGRIEGIFGVAGMVKVFSYTEYRPDILEFPTWWLGQPGNWRPYKVMEGREQAKTLVAQLEGVDDREQARALLGQSIAVPREQLPPLEADTYYWSELVGLQVLNPGGELLGILDHLFETGANDVMVVRAPAGGEILIPYTAVLAVDLAQQQIRVDWQADY